LVSKGMTPDARSDTAKGTTMDSKLLESTVNQTLELVEWVGDADPGAPIPTCPGWTLTDLVGSEYDQVTPSVPTPRPIEVLFHSPVTCTGHRQFSDAAYYTTPSGAGVFATGTSSWICGLVPECTFHPQDQHLVDVVTAITTTLLQAFATCPAAKAYPARDNLGALDITTTTIRDMTRWSRWPSPIRALSAGVGPMWPPRRRGRRRGYA
jgi:hypothetical protein